MRRCGLSTVKKWFAGSGGEARGPAAGGRRRGTTPRMIVAGFTTLALAIGLGGARVANAQDPVPDPQRDRLAAVWAWREGGPAVRAAAAAALVGTDADIQAFVHGGWDLAKVSDKRSAVEDMIALSGPSVRRAGERALAGDAAAIDAFLAGGRQKSATADRRVKVDEILYAGGPNVRAAAQAVLDAGTDQAYTQFLHGGIDAPLHIDLRLQVNQVYASGGPGVRQAAQAALDADTDQAFTDFLDVQWPLQATRDQETATVAQLAAVAEAASADAVEKTADAKEASARAVEAAAVAQQQAEAARAAAQSAQGNAVRAAAAAKAAAAAAEKAAAAAREALEASNAAIDAAQRAARAANQAAAAAVKAGQAAATAYDAAAKAAGDAGSAAAARQAAQTARDAAAGARKAGDAADQAGKAATEAKNAATAATDASSKALTAYQAAIDALNAAVDAGVDATAAIAAANKARANAERAARAAAKASDFAVAATIAAFLARDAARKSAADADAAAQAADAAADAAGHAADAAAAATQHANAATLAAQASVTAANQAQAVFDAARQADADRLAISAEQTDQAALDAAATEQAQTGEVLWTAEQSAQRGAATNQLLAVAADPATPRSAAVAAGRKAALALAVGNGQWTRAAALNALSADDDLVLNFARTTVGFAAGQDDRATLNVLAADGTPAMRTAAAAALAGTDADVAAFLHNPDYPARATEDRVKVNQAMADAAAAGYTTVVARAQIALDAGNETAYREFLDHTRLTGLAVDERVKVNQILAAADSGPEVKAAAQAALDGPSGYVHRFLTVDRYSAAQRDQDNAAHVAEVSALLTRSWYAASKATQAAYEAQATAATARGAAADAAGYAQQAQQSATQAAQYAQQANQSANQAAASADAAVASALAARNAAATAQDAAKAANRSAVWAVDSAKQAFTSADTAFGSARKAADSARAAGQDAQAAALAYNQAANTATRDILNEQAELNRQYCEGTFPAGSADFATCMSQADEHADQKLLQVAANAEMCALMYPPDTPVYRHCLNLSFSPTFENSLLNDITMAAVVELATVLATANVAAAGVGCAVSGLCSAIGLIVGEFVVPGSLMLFLETGGLTFLLGGFGAGAALTVGGLKVSSLLEDTWVGAFADDAVLADLSELWKSCADCAGWRIVEWPGGAIGGNRYVIIDEQAGGATLQTGEESCWAACIEMITNGRLKQADLIAKYGENAKTPERVQAILGPDWVAGVPEATGLTDEQLVDALSELFGPWIARMGSSSKLGHYVIVDGVDDAGLVMIRDPAQGTSYRMAMADFLLEWFFKVAIYHSR